MECERWRVREITTVAARLKEPMLLTVNRYHKMAERKREGEEKRYDKMELERSRDRKKKWRKWVRKELRRREKKNSL